MNFSNNWSNLQSCDFIKCATTVRESRIEIVELWFPLTIDDSDVKTCFSMCSTRKIGNILNERCVVGWNLRDSVVACSMPNAIEFGMCTYSVHLVRMSGRFFFSSVSRSINSKRSYFALIICVPNKHNCAMRRSVNGTGQRVYVYLCVCVLPSD